MAPSPEAPSTTVDASSAGRPCATSASHSSGVRRECRRKMRGFHLRDRNSKGDRVRRAVKQLPSNPRAPSRTHDSASTVMSRSLRARIVSALSTVRAAGTAKAAVSARSLRAGRVCGAGTGTAVLQLVATRSVETSSSTPHARAASPASPGLARSGRTGGRMAERAERADQPRGAERTERSRPGAALCRSAENGGARTVKATPST